MNLGAFVENCSELRHLRLFGMERFTQTRQTLKPSPQYLPGLQRLEIKASGIGEDHRRVPLSCQPSASDLTLLLASAPALVSLSLEMLDNLSDETFAQAIG